MRRTDTRTGVKSATSSVDKRQVEDMSPRDTVAREELEEIRRVLGVDEVSARRALMSYPGDIPRAMAYAIDLQQAGERSGNPAPRTRHSI